jgi:tRNA (guanine-N7-)-methyltransferase
MVQPGESIQCDAAAEIIPHNYFAPLNLQSIYGRTAPLEVDLGCGDGLFLAGIAADNRDHSFLGIERLRGRVLRTRSKIARLELSNARVLLIETSYAIQYLLPSESVAVFHLMFPDPWPKRRHQGRRVMSRNFLMSIHRALISEGFFRIFTDDEDYFCAMESLVSQAPEFSRVADPIESPPNTTFEKRFRAKGIEIHSLVLQKVSPVTQVVASNLSWKNRS